MDRNATTVLAVLAMLLGMASTSWCVTLATTDDFNRSDTSSLGYGWSYSNHVFAVSNNQAINNGDGFNVAYRPDAVLGTGAYTIQCDASGPTDNTQYVGLVYNFKDVDNYCVVRKSIGGYTQFFRLVGGLVTDFQEGYYSAGTTMKVVYDGQGGYKYYLDGVEKRSWSGSTSTDGRGGIFSCGSSTFDNFSLFAMEDFNSSNAIALDKGWIDLSNSFSVKDNAASNSGTDAVAVRYDVSLGTGPFTMQCDVSGPTDNTQYVGLAFNVQDKDNYYALRRTISGWTQFVVFAKGSSPVAKTQFACSSSVMKVAYDGNGTFSFYDGDVGTPIATCGDTTYTSGGAGLYSSKAGRFTDFKISYTDNFNRDASSSLGVMWSDLSGAFTLSDNKAVSSAYNCAIALKVGDDLGSKPFVVEGEVSGMADLNQFAGLVFNYKDPDNYWVIRQTVGGFTQCLKYVNNNPNLISTSYASGKMKVEYDGNGNYKYYVGDTLQGGWSNNSEGGRLGIYVGLGGAIDNFSSETGYGFAASSLDNGWYDVSGAFTVSNSKAENTGKVDAIAIRSDINLGTSPFTVQCDVVGSTDVSDNRYVGLIFNVQDEKNYYLVRRIGSGFYQFLKCVDGSYSEIRNGVSASGDKVKVAGNGAGNFTLYVNETEAATWSDTTYSGGSVGIYSSIFGQFDNFAVTCKSPQADNEATIAVNVNSVLGAVNRKAMGHMLLGADSQYIWGNPDPNLVIRMQGNGIWDNINLRPNFSSATLLRNMRPNILRYPGGSDVKNFDWKTTVGTMAERGENWYWGLMEFLQVCEYVGAEPQICLSSYVGGPDDQIDLVEFLNMPAEAAYPWAMKRASLGHPAPYGVKYFELGNEPYDGNRQVTPYKKWSVEGYADWAKATNTGMKALDPTIKLGLPEWNVNADTEWLMREVGPYVDFAIIHKYPVIYGGDVDLTDAQVNTIFSAFMAAGDQYTRELNESHQKYSTLAGKDMPLAITEFNVFTLSANPVSFRTTLGAGMMNVDLMTQMLKPENHILLANYFQVFNDYWGSLRNDSGNWYNPDSWRTLAPYHCFKLIGEHIGDTMVETSVTCSKKNFAGFSDIAPFTGNSYIPSAQLSTNNLFNLATDFNNLPDTANYQFRSNGITQVKASCAGLNATNSFLGFTNTYVSNFPLDYRPSAGGILYKFSFDARWCPDETSGKPTIGLGLVDSRPWNETGSGIALDGVDLNIAYPVNDNFDRANSSSLGSSWTDLSSSGKYDLVDNKAKYTTTTYAGIAKLNDVNLGTSNFTVQCDLAGPATSSQYVGLVFNYQDANSYYVVRQTIYGYTQFLKYSSGTYTELAPAGYYPGTTMRIDYDGNGNYKFYKDGVEKVTWSNNTLTGGGVGLYANNKVTFDNFSFSFGKWKHFDGIYQPLPDTAEMSCVLRVYDDYSSNGACGMFETQNIRIEPWSSAVYPAYDELRSIATLSSDGSRLYVLVINKRLEMSGSVKATINLNGFNPASARAWTVNGPSVSSNSVKEISNGNSVAIGTSGSVEYLFPAHSITIIEFAQ